MPTLKDNLEEDLKKLGLPLTKIVLLPYSKTFFGQYFPQKGEIRIYIYKDEEHNYRYTYDEIMCTLIHEVIHYIQYKDPDFVRYKGIMHDTDFHMKYNFYKNKYLEMKGGNLNATSHS